MVQFIQEPPFINSKVRLAVKKLKDYHFTFQFPLQLTFPGSGHACVTTIFKFLVSQNFSTLE